MSIEVQLTAAQQRELYALKEQPFKARLMGTCCRCNRGIPHGYLVCTTKWRTSNDWEGIKRSVPDPSHLYCRDCFAQLDAPVERRSRQTVETPSSPEELKAMAVKIYSALDDTKAVNAQKVARLAGVPFSPIVVRILEKLEAAGKVRAIAGRWCLV